MPRPAINVENLAKSYLVGHQAEQKERYVTLRDSMARHWHNFARKAVDVARGRQVVQGDQVEEFWALKDVSFEVREGEVLGIIGRNGAGKSTLLKILSRITEPTSGRVTLHGRVASLLEVGTGFHPELSGRENIFLNGAILGMSRAEVRRKFDEIVAFAEVEKFLDTPVKRYSSGMYVRLAFAVAAHLEPEILIVDEVLAVGDAEFQKKCLGKMDEVSRRHGRTVLFVSHNMRAVSQLTNRAILLSAGRISHSGDTESVVQRYLAEGRLSGSVNFDARNRTQYFGTGDARITYLQFRRASPSFKFNEPLSFLLGIEGHRHIPRIRANVTVYRHDGMAVGCGEGSEISGLAAGDRREMIVTLPPSRISPGSYYCAVSIGIGNTVTGLKDFDVVGETLFFDVLPEDEVGRLRDWHPGWGSISFQQLSVAWEESNAAATAVRT
jgi:homopolymeric O-antigen transport system ATP-binding protein